MFLPNSYIEADVRHASSLKQEDLEWCDILFYNRHCIYAPEFLKQQSKALKFSIVVDTDDVWEIPKSHPKKAWWDRSGVGLQVKQHLMYADAVTTTSTRLADIVPNKNVYVVPNMLPFGDDQYKLSDHKRSGTVKLLYASSIMNYPNTSIIYDAMRSISDLDVEVVIAGHHDSPYFEQLVHNLTGGGVLKHRFTPWVSPDKYMHELDGDIMLLPTKPDKFNSGKSPLKMLEATCLGIPVIASPEHPYRGFPVAYANNSNGWENEIRRLVCSPDIAVDEASELRNFCLFNFDLKKSKRIVIYEDIQRRSGYKRKSDAQQAS